MFIFLIIFLSTFAVNAQDSIFYKQVKQPYSVGFFAGANYVMNYTKLAIIKNTDDCGEFSNGNSSAWLFGVMGEYDIWKNILLLDLHLSFEKRPIYLEAETSSFEVLNQSTNQYENLRRLHKYDAAIHYFAAEISARIKPFKDYPFHFRIGAEASNPISVSSYQISEQIVSPAGILYPNGKLQRVNYEGDVANLNSVYSVNGALGAEFKLNQIVLVPEISYSYGLNSVLAGDWKTQILRITIAARFDLYQEQMFKTKKYSPSIEAEQAPQVVEAVPIPIVEKVENKKSEVKSIIADDIRLTETVVTQTYPILPYIFFDEKSDIINAKYLKSNSVDNFKIEDLSNQTLDIYYNTIDIIGSRLKASKSKITIKGVTDGKELDNEADRLELGKRRAMSLADLLHKRWGIEQSRMSIEFADLPQIQTSEEYMEGSEENRRLEIYSEDSKVLAPIIHSRFMEYTPKRESFTVEIQNENEAKFSNWQLAIFADGKALKSESGTNNPPSEFNIKLNENDAEIIGQAKKLTAKIETQDENGHISKKEYEINIIRDREKFELGRLNLIVFDFDKSDISLSNKAMIKEFITGNIQENSTTKITGSTDKLGEEKYNSRLSLDRAESVARYVYSLKPNYKINEIKGIGSQNLVFDNALPEGRFYCRTVLIEVQTPLE